MFDHYPVSHSLLAGFGWALLVGCAYLVLRRERIGALVLGVLVLSHWGLDALVHRPDLPLYPGSTTVVGLDAWSSLPVTLARELPLFAPGLWPYVRATTPADATGHWGLVALVAFLLAGYAGNLPGPPPPSAEVIAWVGHSQWLLVLWGSWVDKHRQASACAQIQAAPTSNIVRDRPVG